MNIFLFFMACFETVARLDFVSGGYCYIIGAQPREMMAPCRCTNGALAIGSCHLKFCDTHDSICQNGFCCPTCPRNSRMIGLCPSGSCWPYLDAACLNGVCCLRDRMDGVLDYDSCPFGYKDVGRCPTGSQCESTASCIKGRCCKKFKSSSDYYCVNQTAGFGKCINQMCPRPLVCYAGSCCENTKVCLSAGQQSIGNCVDGVCPHEDFMCTSYNVCCPKTL